MAVSVDDMNAVAELYYMSWPECPVCGQLVYGHGPCFVCVLERMGHPESEWYWNQGW